MSRRGIVALLAVWLVIGVGTGLRLHRAGGVFGEAVPLGGSIVAQLAAGVPWLIAAVVAWWAAGRWPVRRDEVLRPFTIQAWIGLGVVVGQQVALAALRATVVAPGLRPFDPWGAMVGEGVTRGPAALAVYGVIAVVAGVLRRSDPRPQGVPAAGRGAGPSS
ncbi:MAG: hypothetical protein KJO11_16740 [Gemmatimonadetes bacterium]|nr:hypothetical protein [Gemmatimonadota bacterium]